MVGRPHQPSPSFKHDTLTDMSNAAIVLTWIIFGGPVAGYIYWDASRRKAGVRVWCVLGLLFSVFALPFYWAYRPLREGEVRSKSKVLAVLKGFGSLWSYLIGYMVVRLVIEGGFSLKTLMYSAVVGGIWLLPFLLGHGPLLMIGVITTNEEERGPTGPLKTSGNEQRSLDAV